MWKWLKRSSNQKALTIIGSGLTAFAIAAWTAYTHFYPSKSGNPTQPSVQADGGVAAGNDINVGRDLNVGVTSEKLREAVEDFARTDLDTRMKEFVELLKYRASIINRQLSSLDANSAADKFDELHSRHVDALLSGNFIIAHEIAREINQLLLDNPTRQIALKFEYYMKTLRPPLDLSYKDRIGLSDRFYVTFEYIDEEEKESDRRAAGRRFYKDRTHLWAKGLADRFSITSVYIHEYIDEEEKEIFDQNYYYYSVPIIEKLTLPEKFLLADPSERPPYFRSPSPRKEGQECPSSANWDRWWAELACPQ